MKVWCYWLKARTTDTWWGNCFHCKAENHLFRYGQRMFCLLHLPKFSDLFKIMPSLGVHSPWLKWLASLIIEDYLMKMCALEQFKKKSQTHCNLVFLYFFLCLQKYHLFTGFPTIFKKIEVIGFLLHWKHI